MNYSIFHPRKELKDLVSHFWVGTWDVNQPPNDVYYIIASSLTEITFAFNNSDKGGQLLFSVIQGHTSKPLQVPVLGFSHLLGVALYSHAIPVLFNHSSVELSEKFLPLTEFLGKNGHVLNEKIALAETTGQRIDIISDYLVSLLKTQHLADPRMVGVIQDIRKFKGNRRVVDLANQSFLSQKQFTRRFRDFSGFNPKMFTRIVRLESAIQNYPGFNHLTELAHFAGYFDQAHFIREFKDLTGFSPTEFWNLSEDNS